jgi:AraC family transcriptional regulator, alkane utilization regulator
LDALSELLRVIHLSGTAFIDAELQAPWAVETPPPSAIAARLAPEAERIIPYHLVVRGACYVQLERQQPVELAAGDVIMFPHGDVHVLASTPGLKPLQITTDLVVKLTRPDSIASTRFGGDGAQTRLICGFFACGELLSEQLVARLPKLIHCQVNTDSAAALLSRSLRPSNATVTLGLGAVLGKLSELLFVDAIRAHVESLPEREGWLASLRDRYVSQGLALMYARPGAGWSLETLAKAVGISRTAFADHFLRCTGMAPMQYLAQWRLRVAADSLAHSDRAIKSIAESAGFGSTPAFTRAFKREFGKSPAKWRRKPIRETAS